MEVFAASTFPDAWSHVVHKPFAARTMLIVGFNPNCAAYKFMRKSDHANLRTDKCDILLANAQRRRLARARRVCGRGDGWRGAAPRPCQHAERDER
jgi:hypothetical protein